MDKGHRKLQLLRKKLLKDTEVRGVFIQTKQSMIMPAEKADVNKDHAAARQAQPAIPPVSPQPDLLRELERDEACSGHLSPVALRNPSVCLQ
jgi:hypothetical protein